MTEIQEQLCATIPSLVALSSTTPIIDKWSVASAARSYLHCSSHGVCYREIGATGTRYMYDSWTVHAFEDRVWVEMRSNMLRFDFRP